MPSELSDCECGVIKPMPPTKLHDWWELPEFTAFRGEVKKCFKAVFQ